MSLHGPAPYLNDDSYHGDIATMMITMFLLAVASELILLFGKFSCFFEWSLLLKKRSFSCRWVEINLFSPHVETVWCLKLKILMSETRQM